MIILDPAERSLIDKHLTAFGVLQQQSVFPQVRLDATQPSVIILGVIEEVVKLWILPANQIQQYHQLNSIDLTHRFS